MNLWLLAASVLLWSLAPCAIVCFRGGALDRFIGLQMATVIVVLTCVLLSRAYGQSFLYDLAVALALLSFGGGMVFVRFLERWL